MDPPAAFTIAIAPHARRSRITRFRRCLRPGGLRTVPPWDSCGIERTDHRASASSCARSCWSIGDDSWIENDRGERVFKVDGKALRIRQTFVLEDAAGEGRWPGSRSAS